MPPIIIVRAIESLLSTLEKYITELIHDTDLPPHPIPPPSHFLRNATATATATAPGQPLSQQNTTVLTDMVFPSIRGLEGR